MTMDSKEQFWDDIMTAIVNYMEHEDADVHAVLGVLEYAKHELIEKAKAAFAFSQKEP